MAYEGYEVPIALGQLGLQTDGPQSQLPPNAAISTQNIAFHTGVLSKSNGTTRFNSASLGSPIVCGYDWWPTPSQQRTIVATADGKIWKDTGDGTFSSATPMLINETQWIQFSSPVTGGFVQWRWNGNNSTGYNYGGVDTVAQVQTNLRTITGLSTVEVTGDWDTGFTVFFPGTSSSQPLISANVNGLLGTGSGSAATSTGIAQWIQFSTVPTSGKVYWRWNGYVTTGYNTPSDSAATVQTNMRTIAGLSTVVVVGDWTRGFVVTAPGVYTPQPLISACPAEAITFSLAVTGGTVTWTYDTFTASAANNGGTDTALQVQTQLRTMSPLANCLVSGDWTAGFTVLIPDIDSPLLIGYTANSLVSGITAVSISVAYIQLLDTSSAVVTTSTTQAQLETITVIHVLAGATGLGTLTTDTFMVAGGNEIQGNPRRLFIYSNGSKQVAMITGDSNAVTGISKPAADWLTTFPTLGVIYNSRHIGFLHHTLYVSKLEDHTDFTTSAVDGSGAAQFAIFPGEGDGIYGATVFKGALLIFKKPFGMYMFQWNGGPLDDPNNVSMVRVSDSFAIASPHAFQQILNDGIGGSNTGSLFSLEATNAFGSFEAGDILVRQAVRNFFRQNFDNSGVPKQQSLFYPEKLLGMFSGRDASGSPQNRILMYDVAGQNPRISVETKDQPTSMWLRKDTNFVPRPVYGANDGYVYFMDQQIPSVNGAPYVGSFQTPYTDFSFLDPKLADKNKLFDFLSITYFDVGNWAFYVDVSVDGSFVQTLTFNMAKQGSVLDSFILDEDELGGTAATLTLRLPLKSCSGKTISFKVYNGLLNQTFTIERLIVSFRESGEQNRSSK